MAAAYRGEERDWRWDAYIDWLCTLPKERVPRTQAEFAEQIGVQPQNISAWRKNPDFLRRWEIRYRETIGSLEKLQAVLNALHTAATDLDDPRMVPAARSYLEAVDAIKPRKIDVNVTQGKAIKELTDDELYAMLGQRAAAELEERQGSPSE